MGSFDWGRERFHFEMFPPLSTPPPPPFPPACRLHKVVIAMDGFILLGPWIAVSASNFAECSREAESWPDPAKDMGGARTMS